VLTTAGVATASATPPVAASSVVLSEHTVDGRGYLVSEITIGPGGSTGWHTHRGLTYGVVRAGVLTHYGSDCRQDGVYGPGVALTDPAGPDHPHIARNLTTEPVVLQVTYVTAAGDPPSDSVADPGCGFS
jgi:quercetin dioxygenase-like cupin family protein